MLGVEIPKPALREAPKGDPIIGEVLKYVIPNHWPKDAEQARNKEIATLVRERQKLHIDDEGLLYRKTTSQSQLVLPKKFHEFVHKELHEEMRHLGVQ